MTRRIIEIFPDEQAARIHAEALKGMKWTVKVTAHERLSVHDHVDPEPPRLHPDVFVVDAEQ